MKNILVTGTFDLLHSGHIAFLETAARYGAVYVGIGSDKSVTQLKNRPPIYTEQERLFIIKSIRYVDVAWINKGMGNFDFMEGFEQDKPTHFDILIVNEDQDFPEKREFCQKYGLEYIVLKRKVIKGFPARSTTSIRRILHDRRIY